MSFSMPLHAAVAQRSMGMCEIVGRVIPEFSQCGRKHLIVYLCTAPAHIRAYFEPCMQHADTEHRRCCRWRVVRGLQQCPGNATR